MRTEPLQGRGKETVRKILDTALALLNTHSPEVLTTNQIADEAGVSIGSLYRYFPDKNQIYRALVDELGTRLLQVIQNCLADPREPLDEVVDRLLVRGLALNEGVPGLKRLLISGDLGPSVTEAAQKTNQEIHGMIRGYLYRMGGESLGKDQADLAALVTIQLFFSLFQSRVGNPELKEPLFLEYRALIIRYWQTVLKRPLPTV